VQKGQGGGGPKVGGYWGTLKDRLEKKNSTLENEKSSQEGDAEEKILKGKWELV